MKPDVDVQRRLRGWLRSVTVTHRTAAAALGLKKLAQDSLGLDAY
jgi:hypothetical protein